MTVHTVLAVAALVASILLLLGHASRAAAAVALVASALEVAMALGLIRVAVAGVPLALVLGLGLAVPGVLVWLRASAKTAVSAATVVALIGILQVALALGLGV